MRMESYLPSGVRGSARGEFTRHPRDAPAFSVSLPRTLFCFLCGVGAVDFCLNNSPAFRFCLLLGCVYGVRVPSTHTVHPIPLLRVTSVSRSRSRSPSVPHSEVELLHALLPTTATGFPRVVVVSMPNKEECRNSHEERARKYKSFLSSLSSAMRQDRIEVLSRISRVQAGFEERGQFLDALVDGGGDRYFEAK